MDKRYNISLTHEEIVILSVLINHKIKNKSSACKYYNELVSDISSRVNKAMDRAEKDIDKYNKQIMEGK